MSDIPPSAYPSPPAPTGPPPGPGGPPPGSGGPSRWAGRGLLIGIGAAGLAVVLAVVGVVVWVQRNGTESGRTTLVAQATGSPSRAALDRTAAVLAKRARTATFDGV